MDEEELTTETSVFVCAPYPVPECFDSGTDIGEPLGPIDNPANVEAQVPTSTPTAVQATEATMTPQTAAPAVAAHVESLPYTGIEGTLALLGAGLVAVGLALVRLARERSCKVLRPVR